MTPGDFFAVSDAAFAPFMREPVEVRADFGVVSLRASVLLVQKDGPAFADMTGDTFSVQFLRRDWPLDALPSKGSIVAFGHPPRRLFVVSAQPVGGCVHLKCSENPGY